MTYDFSIMAKFKQASQCNATDPNTVIAEMQYFGLLKGIIGVDYQSFNMLIFDMQWFKVVMK